MIPVAVSHFQAVRGAIFQQAQAFANLKTGNFF